MDVKNNSGALQAQLQAQLDQQQRQQVRQQPIQDQRAQDIASRGQLPDTVRDPFGQTKPPAKSERGTDLSSQAEVEDAKKRVASFTTGGAGTSEAPFGRLSQQRDDGRDVPLGSIIDIRV
ncbi:hypothetical protein GCM10017044_05560 [Kordiimonas sediminis]|uniref:Uncharacterized protein n=1 Tax=Kordiimonas sediminis TaxID=1735581 RepID=A0A919ALL6_9PROT|nr:hypothetical protein [Kordiimonas sediminis]GHF14359.1 hypothetical protein GCM10017044_05560 [Kordiimonas sediminis]